MMTNEAAKSISTNKQLGVLQGNWLLVHYPEKHFLKLVPSKTVKDEWVMESDRYPAYFVLANMATHAWTIGLDSSFAKNAPTRELLTQLQSFYPGELSR